MIRDIDFSHGQILILKDMAEIYNNNLMVNLNKFHDKSFSPIEDNIMELYKMIGLTRDKLQENFEDEFFRYVDLKANPGIITEFELFDIVILKFILLDWAEEKEWNDLEVANLLIKLDILIEMKNLSYENTKFTMGDN
jgi:hypothetical protein